ncbi:MAG: BTAD domain-containing putative transcriptional regulator [Streptosporangiaceae bacterium]
MAALSTARLPVRLSSLVGRRRELTEVVQALRQGRLVTLTGPGGTGKTRLALAAAQAAGEGYPGGVLWVDLAPVGSQGAVAAAVAGQLKVADTTGPDVARAIAEQLGDEPVLLVLDNCEHLTGAVADLAGELLGSCPALTILATSRELLGVEGEQGWPVPPLSLPGGETGPAAPELAGYDAITLFEQRARLVRPDFRVTGENAAAVVAVCRRLDGLPLAIELAAARMRIMSASQLAERLDDVFAVLTGGARTAPRRHQALRATLDWSYDLLEPEERVVFRRLAVFAGGCTLAAAEHVAAGPVEGGPDIEAGRMIELLARLADKSLLLVEHAGDVRYHLLAVVRDYARGRLAEAGELEQTRRAQLHWLASLAEEIEPLLDGGGQAMPPGALDYQLDRLDAEMANLRAALEFARDNGDAVTALRLAGSLVQYAYLRGQHFQVRQWLDAAIAAGDGAPAGLRARALAGSGRLALLQCDYSAAARRLEAALALQRELGDDRGIAAALQVLGSVAREQGSYQRSIELHEQGLAVAQAAGDTGGIAAARNYLAFTSWLRRDFERAGAEAATALEQCRALGDQAGVVWALISLGAVARYQGAAQRAAELLGQSRSLADQIGFREGVAWSLEQLGLLAADQGDPAALDLLRESLQLHRELRDRWRTASLLDDLAALALGRGHADQATRLLAAAEAMRRAIGTVVAPCESARHGQTLAGARDALGDQAFEAAWRQGLLAAIRDLQAELAAAAAAAAAADGPAVSAPAVAPAAGETAAAATARPPAAGVTAVSPVVPAAGVTTVSPVVSPAAGVTAAGPVVQAPAAPSADPAPAGQAPAAPSAGEGHADDRRAAGASRAGPAGGEPAATEPAAGAADVAAPLRIRVLGAATVQRGEVALSAADWGYGKPRELFFLLATSGPLTREQIGAALWPDQGRQQLGNALHTALRELRRALGDPGWIRFADGKYAFSTDREHDSDIETFEQALRAARAARPAAAALPDLQRAIAAYGGDFLDGAAAGDWAQARRDELRRSYEAALLAAGRLHAAAGRHQAAVTAFRRAVAHEPLNETAHRELMTSWARLGEAARALAHYQELARTLRDQLGVDPAAETSALYRRLGGQ